MDKTKIEYIKEYISQLPKGNITYKTIKGKKYPYLQWTEDGKQRNRRVREDELEDLKNKIFERKELEKKLKELQQGEVDLEENFFAQMMLGDELLSFRELVKGYEKRECYSALRDYVYGDRSDKVFILYGLRRTGKTTLIRQVIAEMDEAMLAKTAFMQITSEINLARFNLDMRRLSKRGYQYIFIDEVTMMDDFIEDAAILSDIFAVYGMKIVLSGTDSLGFIFSQDSSLYDRCHLLHTTFVPYREFERVLEIRGIDEYIRYGGTMSMGGVDYNKSATFASDKSTNDYVDSAIAHNIQHSLKNYRNGDHFRSLQELYDANELTSAINRIVEDINHRFTYEVLTRDFKSGDLSLSAKNLLKDKENPSAVLYQIDTEEVTARLKDILEIKNRSEQSIHLTDSHRNEIKEYLDLLDITVDIDIVSLNSSKRQKHTVVTQPGMRYSQARSLIDELIEDEFFMRLPLNERNQISRRILSDVMGRMMEEIILLETKTAFPDKDVFKLVFATGEFDMVIFDAESESCEIFEIKHSSQRVPEQYRHLIDKEKCSACEFRFGKITGRSVIYRGETIDDKKVKYINVEDYLNSLGKKEHI